jgi:8-oxo-dGTP pyrophosphatase MutT (NUDIX family)
MPAAPVPAATVILLRDGERSPEVLLLERHARSEFLPDMYVFPGGRVEEQDRELLDRLSGVSAPGAARLLPTVDPALAPAFLVAAIRETFEECGLLLCRPRGSSALIDPARARALARHRLEVQAGRTPFREIVEAEDLELAGELLVSHAHWITPESVPRRFDTLFFSALAPAGQLAAHDGIEATDSLWIRPEDALLQAGEGRRQIIFPTACNLQVLCGFESAAQALEASRARPVFPVLPRLVERDGVRKLVIPPEAGYPRSEERVEASPR